MILGIDPGKTGGGLLVSHRQAVCAFWWRARKRKGSTVYDLQCCHADGWERRVHPLRAPWEVGIAIRTQLSPTLAPHDGVCTVAAESAHIGRNAHTGIALSRWAGALLAPLESLDPTCAAAWVEPDEWRAAVLSRGWWKATATAHGMAAHRATAERLGCGFMQKREAAKLAALKAVPEHLPNLLDLPIPERALEHVADAAGIALWRSGII